VEQYGKTGKCTHSPLARGRARAGPELDIRAVLRLPERAADRQAGTKHSRDSQSDSRGGKEMSVYYVDLDKPIFTPPEKAEAVTGADRATSGQRACINALCRVTSWLPVLFMQTYFPGLDLFSLNRNAADAVIKHLKQLDRWQRQNREA
jgi:hypothetical protein